MACGTYISLVADQNVCDLLVESFGEGFFARADNPPKALQSSPSYKWVRFSFIDEIRDEYILHYLKTDRRRETPKDRMLPQHILGYKVYYRIVNKLTSWFRSDSTENVNFAKIKLTIGFLHQDQVLNPSQVLREQTFTKRDNGDDGDGFRQVPPSSPNGIKQPVHEYSVSGSRRSKLLRKFRTALPINKFELAGDWSKNRSFKTTDRQLLQNPKAVQKIKNIFDKTEHNFDIYFLNNFKMGQQYVEHGQARTEELDDLRAAGLPIQPNPNAITIVYTNNKGTQAKPMTAWIIAHRMSHVLRRGGGGRDSVDEVMFRLLPKLADKLLSEVYGYKPQYNGIWATQYPSAATQKAIKLLLSSIGTFKSAEQRTLLNHYEFIHELFAQYLLTGDITLKPLPDSVQLAGGDKRPVMYRKRQDGEDLLEQLKWACMSAFENELGAAYGKVYLM